MSGNGDSGFFFDQLKFFLVAELPPYPFNGAIIKPGQPPFAEKCLEKINNKCAYPDNAEREISKQPKTNAVKDNYVDKCFCEIICQRHASQVAECLHEPLQLFVIIKQRK
jgi:hypothetical protein